MNRTRNCYFLNESFIKRKIYQDLLKWKNDSNGKTTLLVEGARRVEKSYIVEEFAKENYMLDNHLLFLMRFNFVLDLEVLLNT